MSASAAPIPGHDARFAAGKRFVVTGGAGGIGRALVRALADSGAEVTCLDLPASLAAHPQPSGVRAIACDVTSERAVSEAFDSVSRDFGGLDGLVTLAGFALEHAPVAETRLADWSAVLDGNLTSTFLACKAALPLLRREGGGAIVTMASGLALKSSPGYGPYAASKAAILSLTRLIAQENAPLVRANAVAPSAVETAFLRGGTGRGGDAADAALRMDLPAYLKTVPLARLAQPEDVTGPILFLLSPAAAYVTGQTLHVNGGSLMI